MSKITEVFSELYSFLCLFHYRSLKIDSIKITIFIMNGQNYLTRTE